MKVLVTGAAGQLGLSLKESCPAAHQMHGVDIDVLDITDREAVFAAVAALQPQVIINAAAHTAVDRAETDAARAQAINADGARHLAEAAAAEGARIIQISTDFVFDGGSSRPYQPGDIPNPLSVYGSSKLAGEQAVLAAAGDSALIVRTAWVYSAHGSNFVKTMLRLFAEREEVRVVADQIGTPTHAASLARALWALLDHPQLAGIQHWTDAGVASWYDFAHAIHDLGWVAKGGQPRRLLPISSEQYPTPARRPAYSVLDKSALYERIGGARHWRDELKTLLG